MTNTHNANVLLFHITTHEDDVTVVSILREDQMTSFGDTYLFNPANQAVDFIKECIDRGIIGHALKAAAILSSITGDNRVLRDITEYLAPRLTPQAWSKVNARTAFVVYDRSIPFHDNNASTQGA